jgi:hypothetical protein
MRKVLTIGCVSALALMGGAGMAQACDDEVRGYSYAPRTYGYSYYGYGPSYAYAPAYYYDDDYAYGYGPGIGVNVYSDFDRRGRRFRHHRADRDRGDRIRSTRVSTRSEGLAVDRGRQPERGDRGLRGGGERMSPDMRSGGGSMGGNRGGDGMRGR